MKINESNAKFYSLSNRGSAMQTEREKTLATEIFSDFEKIENSAVLCVFGLGENLFACIMPTENIKSRFFIRGNAGKEQKKIYSPLNKKQVVTECTKIGNYADFVDYKPKDSKLTKNDGLKIEKFLEKINGYKIHANHSQSLENGGDAFKVNGKVCEIKFFDFNKTTGTPQATCGKRKA